MNKQVFKIGLILLLGFLARVSFTFFLAPFYFNTENYWIGGDTGAWVKAFTNLVEHGTFSTSLVREYGFAGRMPGYSFILGPLYYLCGSKLILAAKVMACIQIILDTVNIYLIYKIVNNLKVSSPAPLICAILYAFYPFVIVWNPVAYSEQPSLFFMLLGISLMTKNSANLLSFFTGGVSIGWAILMRPQILPLAGIIELLFLVNIFKSRLQLRKDHLVFLAYSAGLMLGYGVWPIRNYIFHDKIMLTQDLRGLKSWDVDLIAFRQFAYSVKAEWNPQFNNLLKDEKVEFPLKNMTREDEEKLQRAIYLAKNCSYSFGNWKLPEKVILPKKKEYDTCKYEIQHIFDDLRAKQIKTNPVDYYLIIPLENLKKCFFKLNLYNEKTSVRSFASLLFCLRSLLILTGLFFYVLIIKQKQLSINWLWIVLGYFGSLYFLLSFGTSSQMRNIEMRYLLPGDVLLLMPAGILISHLLNCLKKILLPKLKTKEPYTT